MLNFAVLKLAILFAMCILHILRDLGNGSNCMELLVTVATQEHSDAFCIKSKVTFYCWQKIGL